VEEYAAGGLAADLEAVRAAAEAAEPGTGMLAVRLVGMVRDLGRAVTLEEVEQLAVERSREIGLGSLQLALDGRAEAEAADPLPGVTGADGLWRGCRERSRVTVITLLGKVTVRRVAYRSRARGVPGLHPRDAALNLPASGYSWQLQKLAEMACRAGSFQSGQDLVRAATGITVGKRQLEAILAAAAGDAEEFAGHRELPAAPAVAGPDGKERPAVLAMSADAKGVAMRPDALRPATARKDAMRRKQGRHRLGSGQKQARKRMAETGAVFDSLPPQGPPRTPHDIMLRPAGTPPRAPGAVNKWYACGITAACAEVIARVFGEADRRDPERQRDWLALVDGNDHQIACFQGEAAARGKDITILIDFIHVIEYLWKAALAFTPPGDTRATEDQATAWGLAILAGRSGDVAAGIRARAAGDPPKPGGEHEKSITRALSYLGGKQQYMNYPKALAEGWPIATGVIEGACRHLVGDRLGITGARWSLDGAQAMLWMRATAAGGDLHAYWDWHIAQEHQRNHLSKFQDACTLVA
jgi:hypothetical protein